MAETYSIDIDNISKKFDIRYTTVYGGRAKSGTKQVLEGLSLKVRKGEILGLVGRNGSGKSTLLKIISGITFNDSGKITINGKVASILELGMGFDPELSGRENMRLKSSFFGFNDKEIDSFMDDMIQFSELGEQIEHPLRTYSSGMVAKLAFSVLTHVKCDILVIDEILSVGDPGFNAKCKMVFDRMRKEGKTVVLASHNMNSLEDMCDRVAWMEAGKVREIGDPMVVCHAFKSDAVESPRTVRELAEAGDSQSQYRYGSMLRDGIAVPRDIDQSKIWFERASAMGHTDSMVALGRLLLSEGKEKEAIDLFRKASVAGNNEATSALVSMDREEKSISEKFIGKVSSLAESGNGQACRILADCYLNGICIAKDQAKAVEWYIKAADNGETSSVYTLGKLYRDGTGVQKDGAEAVRWFTIAGERGNVFAMNDLAMMYMRGIGVERDMESCIKWLEKAAECGFVGAMSQLGKIYRDGMGVDKNEEKSRYWFSMFAKQGRMRYETELGDVMKNVFIGEERKEALEWYSDAAENGYPMALMKLGYALHNDNTFECNNDLAIEYLEKAAAVCNHIALYDLAMMYYRGECVTKDHKKAFEYMKCSADIGNNNARYQLALMYMRGIGTEVDMDEAKRYARLSADSGNPEMKGILREMKENN